MPARISKPPYLPPLYPSLLRVSSQTAAHTPLAVNSEAWVGEKETIPEVHVTVHQQGHQVGEISARTAATEEYRHRGHLIQLEDESQQEGQQRQEAELAERGQQRAHGPPDVCPEVVHVHGAAQAQHGDAQGGSHEHVQPVVERCVPERGLVGDPGPGESGGALAGHATREAAARGLWGPARPRAETHARARSETEPGAGAGGGSERGQGAGARAAGVGRQGEVVRQQRGRVKEQGGVVQDVHGAVAEARSAGTVPGCASSLGPAVPATCLSGQASPRRRRCGEPVLAPVCMPPGGWH